MVCDFVERLDPKIVIERLFGEAPLGLLVAPNWGLNRNEVIAGIRERMDERDVVQGSRGRTGAPYERRTLREAVRS